MSGFTSSGITRLVVQAATPLAVALALYLFFAGHNQPGGGFAAGLVFGAVVALRTMAGLQRPTQALELMAAGVVIAGAVAIAPVVFGSTVFDQDTFEVTLPLLGKVKSGSAAVFDLGVTLVVVGLVAAVLNGFGVALLTGAADAYRSAHPDEEASS